MKITKTTQFVAALICVITLSSVSEARRHRKFKGVIIVNQILKLNGKITRNGEDAPEFSGVKQGDLLETADKSSAVIRIPGLAIFQMGPNTKFKLTKFNDRNESVFELLGGNVLALYRRVGNHEFRLNHSTIKLHGTTFFAETLKEKDSICLCEGKIDISDTAVKPESAPTPMGTPLFGASLTAATPIGGGAPKPTPNPTPTSKSDSILRETELVSKDEHKQCDISEKGISLSSKEKLLDLHSQDEIKDLESLYALP